jgi:serine/threonine protein kinase
MYLCNASKLQSTYGLNPLSDDDRAMLAIRCTSFIHYLHKNGFVYGDISFNNILIHYDKHTPLFIDCDSISSTKRGVGFMKQAHTSGFIPPEWQQPICTITTDVYKLALLIVRLFDQTEQPRQANFSSSTARQRIVAAFGANAWDVIGQAGHEDPRCRPSARDILEVIHRK